MGCCTGLFRFLLFTFNIACFLIGLAMIIIGIVYEVSFYDLTGQLDEISPVFQLVPILMIVVGSIIFVIAFLGCCGTWRKNSCMLTTYAVILIIILVLQIAFVIFTFIQVNNTDSLREDVYRAVSTIFEVGTATTNETVDFLQSTLQCCGVDGPPLVNIPQSCCVGTGPCLDPFTTGCGTALYDFLNTSMKVIGIVAATLAAIELIAAILALWIARKKKY